MSDEATIKFERPHCAQHIKASATTRGTQVGCPACLKHQAAKQRRQGLCRAMTRIQVRRISSSLIARRDSIESEHYHGTSFRGISAQFRRFALHARTSATPAFAN
jgi:hypothetical protein